jgi:hypothetical protein
LIAKRWIHWLFEAKKRFGLMILKNGSNQRDSKWTEAIAVCDKEFVMETKAKLGAKAMGRRELEDN